MPSANRRTIPADASFALVAAFIFSSQIGFSQTIDKSSFSKVEHRKIESILTDWKHCDDISAEGLRLECTKKILASFESEIHRINAEVRRSLPVAQRYEFDRLCLAWDRYFEAEKKHWREMGMHMGTVAWIGSHNSLVQIAKTRAEFLLTQLP